MAPSIKNKKSHGARLASTAVLSMTSLVSVIGLGSNSTQAQPATDAAQAVQLEELAVAGNGGSLLTVDGYLAKDSISATRTDTPLREVPQTVVVVPNQVLEDAAAGVAAAEEDVEFVVAHLGNVD